MNEAVFFLGIMMDKKLNHFFQEEDSLQTNDTVSLKTTGQYKEILAFYVA